MFCCGVGVKAKVRCDERGEERKRGRETEGKEKKGMTGEREIYT